MEAARTTSRVATEVTQSSGTVLAGMQAVETVSSMRTVGTPCRFALGLLLTLAASVFLVPAGAGAEGLGYAAPDVLVGYRAPDVLLEGKTTKSDIYFALQPKPIEIRLRVRGAARLDGPIDGCRLVGSNEAICGPVDGCRLAASETMCSLISYRRSAVPDTPAGEIPRTAPFLREGTCCSLTLRLRGTRPGRYLVTARAIDPSSGHMTVLARFLRSVSRLPRRGELLVAPTTEAFWQLSNADFLASIDRAVTVRLPAVVRPTGRSPAGEPTDAPVRAVRVVTRRADGRVARGMLQDGAARLDQDSQGRLVAAPMDEMVSCARARMSFARVQVSFARRTAAPRRTRKRRFGPRTGRYRYVRDGRPGTNTAGSPPDRPSGLRDLGFARLSAVRLESDAPFVLQTRVGPLSIGGGQARLQRRCDGAILVSTAARAATLTLTSPVVAQYFEIHGATNESDEGVRLRRLRGRAGQMLRLRAGQALVLTPPGGTVRGR